MVGYWGLALFLYLAISAGFAVIFYRDGKKDGMEQSEAFILAVSAPLLVLAGLLQRGFRYTKRKRRRNREKISH